MTQLNLSFFGTLQASLNKIPITNFRSVKIQGLLIFLTLTANQAHSRETLAALFWPDVPDSGAKKNLRQSLYRLRQLLRDSEESERPLRQGQGKPFLLISRTMVQWNPASNTRLDVADFLAALEREAWETAVFLPFAAG